MMSTPLRPSLHPRNQEPAQARRRRPVAPLAFMLSALLLLVSLSLADALIPPRAAHARLSARGAAATSTQHYLYVFPDGLMDVYDLDNNFNLVSSTTLPTSTGVRGVVASPATGMLYVSYGSASTNPGSLMKYNLLTNTVVWTQTYTFGIDSMGITPDGKTIYMPDGEFSGDNHWYVIDAGTGNVITSITAGTGPHNTIVSLNGKHVYMAGRYTPYLEVADTATNTISNNIGPLKSGGRPFSINGTETLAYTTSDNFLGFQVSSITTGQVLYSVPVQGFNNTGALLVPSHGISLSPDEKEIYVMDGDNSYVHVFDVSGLPAVAPTQVADIKLSLPIAGHSESGCAFDCGKEGWVLHSGDGRYVFIGDSGDIISTATHQIVANLTPLTNSRKYLEIDWQNGAPSFTTSRYGLGYVTGSTPPPTPTATTSVTPTVTATPTLTPTPSPTATPVPGSILARDTFQRPNQTLWGTASDGHVWGGDANTNSAFAINGNSGTVAGATSLSAVLGPSATDAEVYFTGQMSTFSGNNLGAILRWTDGNDWYKAYLDGSRLVLQKRVGGAYTTLATSAFAATANTLYALRFQAMGTTLLVRAWPASGTEPASWMLSRTDASLASGVCGLRMLTQGGSMATYTAFVATSLSGSPAPTPTPTRTATPTATAIATATPTGMPTATATATATPTGTPPPTPTPSPTPRPTPTPTPTATPTPTPSPSPSPSPSPTPTVGTVIATDTFTRPNQAQWGLASDGINTWGADASTSGAFSITNNTGQVANAAGSYSAILGKSATDAQVLFSGSMSAYGSGNLGAILRWSDGNDWYKAYIQGSLLVIQKQVGGAYTTLATYAFTAVGGTSYSLRFQATGTTLSARVWQTGSAEPATWQITISDSSFASGYCGLRMLAPSGVTASYTSFVATAP